MSLHPPDLIARESASFAPRAAARPAARPIARITYALVDAPVGRLVAVVTTKGLVRLAYELENGGIDGVLGQVSERLSPSIAEAPSRLDGVRRELDEYFAGRRRAFSLALDWSLAGPGFARRVLEAALAIEFGATRSYRDVAAAAGSANGYRAAGNALGANPLPIVIPCHRVLASSGGLGGYTGGLERKRVLLDIERHASGA